MLITRLHLKNWRNFRTAELKLRDVGFVLGPNASGKSNLLDVFRFLRDVSKANGGGLQAAVAQRGGLGKIRCLHARNDPGVQIDVGLSASPDDAQPEWRYVLGFGNAKKSSQVLVAREQVYRGDKKLIDRPNDKDGKDPLLLSQTFLEQIQQNGEFRQIAEFFSETTYLHLVPQLLKHGDRIGGQRLDDDPFGQGFLERIAQTRESTRTARLKKIGKALALAVPQFKELRFEKDELGRPHVEARYEHHRPNAGWQREEHFSDGTLRLLGLLWSLLEGSSLLLLEEPEISLNDAIVRQIPAILEKLQSGRTRRQILVSTHSEALLSNPGIDGRNVILLEPSAEGTNARHVTEREGDLLRAGLSLAEVLLPKTRPERVNELANW